MEKFAFDFLLHCFEVNTKNIYSISKKLRFNNKITLMAFGMGVLAINDIVDLQKKNRALAKEVRKLHDKVEALSVSDFEEE